MSEEKKDGLAKEVFQDVSKNLKKDVQDRSKSIAMGIINDAVDILSNNIRRGFNHFIYPDGTGPKNNNSSNGVYRNYESYSNYASYASSGYKTDRDRRASSDDSPTNLKLVTWRNEAQASERLDELLKKIDANGAARVGDLYELGDPKVPTHMMDWKYGWEDQDKGGFDKRYIASGPHAGDYMAIAPKPHLLRN